MAPSTLSRNRGVTGVRNTNRLILFIFSLLSLAYVANSLSNKELLVNDFLLKLLLHYSSYTFMCHCKSPWAHWGRHFLCRAEATETLTTAFWKFQEFKEKLRKAEENAAKMKVSQWVSCWSHVSGIWNKKCILVISLLMLTYSERAHNTYTSKSDLCQKCFFIRHTEKQHPHKNWMKKWSSFILLWN